MSKAEKLEHLQNTNESVEFPAPYLGRSVRIVGDHVNVDMNQSPHPKNQRGELGKPLFNWYRNTVSKDPLTRVSAPNQVPSFVAGASLPRPRGKNVCIA